MVTTQKIEFRKLRDFGELINVTFEFLRQNLKTLGLSLLFIVGPLTIISGITGGIYNAARFNNISSLQLSFDWPLFFLHYIFVLITIHLLVTVTYSYIFLYFEKDITQIEVSDVFSKTKELFFPFLFTSIGVFFSIMIAMLLFIIPGIYLSIALSTIYAVKMFEHRGFFDSFERCRYLIKNNWWFTFGLILIFAVIQYFFSFILQVPMTIATFVGMMHTINKGSSVSEVIVMITSIVYMFSIFFYTIGIIGITFHYFNLVEQKEARGLMQKLDTINTTNNIS